MVLTIHLLGETFLKELKTPEEAINFVCNCKQWVRDILGELGHKEQCVGTLKSSFEIHTTWCNANDDYNVVFKITRVRATRWVDNKPYGKAEVVYVLDDQTITELERCVDATNLYLSKNGETK
jgi:hypothetical protein